MQYEATASFRELEEPDRFRRVLLGAVTALIVARPLVAGEDPGRLHSPESISGIVLNLLGIVAVVVGAVWLARSRRPMRLGGWLPICLLAVPALVLLSTF